MKDEMFKAMSEAGAYSGNTPIPVRTPKELTAHRKSISDAADASKAKRRQDRLDTMSPSQRKWATRND